MYMSHFVYLFTCQWTIGLLPLIGYVNNAAMNMSIQLSLQDPAFNYFGYLLISGIADHMVALFLIF